MLKKHNITLEELQETVSSCEDHVDLEVELNKEKVGFSIIKDGETDVYYVYIKSGIAIIEFYVHEDNYELQIPRMLDRTEMDFLLARKKINVKENELIEFIQEKQKLREIYKK